MTPDQARQVLDDVRDGRSCEPASRIRLALQMTGDIDGPWADAKAGPDPYASREPAHFMAEGSAA